MLFMMEDMTIVNISNASRLGCFGISGYLKSQFIIDMTLR